MFNKAKGFVSPSSDMKTEIPSKESNIDDKTILPQERIDKMTEDTKKVADFAGDRINHYSNYRTPASGERGNESTDKTLVMFVSLLHI